MSKRLKNKYMAAEGGTEMLFEECANRAEAQRRIRELFSSSGFCEVVTPTLEYYDLFAEGAGALDQSDMYALSDRLGRLLVLRPDSTKPIARLYASRLKNLAFPVRLYYNQNVFRRNVALSRKTDEVLQIGAELLGAGGLATDLEIINLAVESLAKVSDDFLFELSHIGIYRSLIGSLGISEDLAEQIRENIASKNYSALDELLEENGVKEPEKIKILPRLFGGEEVLEEARALFSEPEILATLDYLGAIMAKLKQLGAGGRISFDLALVNEYNYYTGVVFKGYTSEGGEVLSGGRYDTLYADFGLSVDAVGFAVDLGQLSLSVGTERPRRTLVVCSDVLCGLKAQKELLARGETCELFVTFEDENALSYAKKVKADRILFAERGETVVPGEDSTC